MSYSGQVQTLRQQMAEMRDQMLMLEKNSVDVGRNPGKAMRQYGNEKLDSMFDVLENQIQLRFEEISQQRGNLEKQEVDVNSQIYDQQMRQVRLKQDVYDQRCLVEDLENDSRLLMERIAGVKDSKLQLQQRIELVTSDFV